ncbi:hypothetical protein F2P81_015176 [Scophthalmus maximus]|uniref:Uncharacterized protein n=1 Tax=Scophthalmus maximus TaxID=52904 RepID=A0A6A4SCL6_SCOMX|nr:hypothetical protein F2P81_015176 [Scophthalmus maximus]
MRRRQTAHVQRVWRIRVPGRRRAADTGDERSGSGAGAGAGGRAGVRCGLWTGSGKAADDGLNPRDASGLTQARSDFFSGVCLCSYSAGIFNKGEKIESKNRQSSGYENDLFVKHIIKPIGNGGDAKLVTSDTDCAHVRLHICINQISDYIRVKQSLVSFALHLVMLNQTQKELCGRISSSSQ